MRTKKEMIISSFENLDAYALGNLLDENRTYQDVPKLLFIEKYAEYFQELKGDESIVCDFKAFRGKCEGCSKGKTGYSFINSEGFCFAELVFIEEEEDFSDIYFCSKFVCSSEEIVHYYDGPTFYDDEKVGYELSFDQLVEKEFCLRGVQEIENELLANTVLTPDFMMHWLAKFGARYKSNDFLNPVNLSFIFKLKRHIGSVNNAMAFIKLNMKAKLYLSLYKNEVFTDTEAKMMWLLSCLEDIPDIKLYLHAKVNEDNSYITFSKINVSLALMTDYIQLQKLFNSWSHLLPYSVLMSLPHNWTDNGTSTFSNEETDWIDDYEFPF